MVDYIRKFVSGKRKRIIEDGFKLDMSYITTKLIAMSYPGSGFASVYRNHIDDVARFLNLRHPDHYTIYNLTTTQYDYTKFNGHVVDKFGWKDHTSPSLCVLFELVNAIFNYLSEDPKNTAVLHCAAGKGRTGTAICSTLLFTGFVSKMDEAIQYYSEKRYEDGDGVTQPAQLRYLRYFEQIYDQEILSPAPLKALTSIEFNCIPNIASGGFMPYIEIHEEGKEPSLIYTDKKSHGEQNFYKLSLPPTSTTIQILPPVELRGDITIKVFHNGRMYDSMIFRIVFNVYFVPQSNILEMYKEQLDPRDTKKDKRLNEEFVVKLLFTDIEEFGPTAYLDPGEEHKHREVSLIKDNPWKSIHVILNDHHRPSIKDSPAGFYVDEEEPDS